MTGSLQVKRGTGHAELVWVEVTGGLTRPHVVLLAVLATGLGVGLVSARAVESGGEAASAASTSLIVLMLLSVVPTVVAAVTCRGRARAAWAVLALFPLVAAGVQVALLLGDETRLPLVAAGRALMIVVGVTGVLLFPGVTRSVREWSLLMLDGWLTAGALATVLWTVVVPDGDAYQLLTERHGAIVWFLADLVMVCVMIGLVRRMPGRLAASALALAAATMLVTFGDLSWAVFGVSPASAGRAGYVGAWTAAMVIGLAAPWLGRGEPFGDLLTGPRRMGSVRIPHLLASIAIACEVVSSATGRQPDVVDAALVLLLLAAMLVSLLLLARENRLLYRDMVEQADRLRDQASRDALTGLPNRREFTRHVRRALDGPGRGRVAVVFIDLDGFKHVNDTFGHEAGDVLLTETAARLAGELRGGDVVARFGGDEFVALLVDCTDEQGLQIAERLRFALGRPYRVGDRDLVVSASLGLARPLEGDDADAALRNADLALYRAKEQGRDRVATYRPDMHASAVRHVGGVARLRQAIAEDRLSLQFQPVVDLRTGALHTLEALLRFDEADLPGWSLDEVIRAAEDSGLMVPLGRWVVEAAIGQLGVWRAEGCDVHVAINLSARQLEQDDLVATVHAELVRHGVPADRLTLEITEHELVGDISRSSAVLSALRGSGVRVVLDDFGTGYSSLRYLPMLPLDGLKIDGELTAGIGGVRDIVPAVLRLGHDLDLAVVAEGIETVEQLVLLREAGCMLGQGYLLGRPLDPAAATALVRTGRVPLPLAARPADTFVPDVETQVADA